MKTSRVSQKPFVIFATVYASLLGIALLNAQRAIAQPQAAPEELTQGPLHEAFGQPVTFNPQPGIVVPKKPPEPVEELPPDQKPEGDNVVWISGYWNWDDQRTDFIWVSGFWRNVPPGRNWVAGYWAPAGDKYQWVSGFWASTETNTVEYLPAPPESLESGPSIEQPSADTIWAPGCWVWRDRRYFWRPGHWITASPDWVWVPEHYEWTPSGYLFAGGYWDYAIGRRGLLFAPVVFPPGLLAQRGYVYTPSVVLDSALLTNFLFARPDHRHYYFGDYYAPENIQAGIYPWFAHHNSRLGYDPLYAQLAWENGRQDKNWLSTQREQYFQRRDHVEARPPHTFAATQALARQPNAKAEHFMVAKPLAEVAQQKNRPVPLQKIEAPRVQEFKQHATQTRAATQQRSQFEAKNIPVVPRVDPKRTEPIRPPVVQNPPKFELPKRTTVITPPKVAAPVHQPPAPPQVPQHMTAAPPKVVQPLPHPADVLKPQPQPQPKKK